MENNKEQLIEVQRADNCIWIVDHRNNDFDIHLTVGQAKQVAKDLFNIVEAE